MTDTTTARREMWRLFNDAWKADTPAVWGGKVPEVRWQAKEEAVLPASDAAWARVQVIHNPAAGGQATFGEQAHYERVGLMTIQVFAPNANNQGLAVSEKLAIIARNALEGKRTASGVVFYRVGHTEVGADGPWYQFNVVAEFQYYELK